MRRRHWLVTLSILALALVGGAVKWWLVNRAFGQPLSINVPPVKYSVEQRLAQFAPLVEERLVPHFAAAGVPYPPSEVALVAFKDTRRLELHARANNSTAWTLVHRYAVLGASGQLGPKLAEGDRQVPEGLYRVELLNPNSRYHLSIRLNYPNEFDREVGALDGRSDLGSDIMIHGGTSSVGCLAIGDEAAEDLFVLVALTGIDNTRVVVSPTDFRARSARTPDVTLPWAPRLYARLREELSQFPRTSSGERSAR